LAPEPVSSGLGGVREVVGQIVGQRKGRREMTRKEIEENNDVPLGIESALVLAYEAGCSRMIADSGYFKQIHADRADVVKALARRIKKGGAK
jgi:hypothetical protein